MVLGCWVRFEGLLKSGFDGGAWETLGNYNVDGTECWDKFNVDGTLMLRCLIWDVREQELDSKCVVLN